MTRPRRRFAGELDRLGYVAERNEPVSFARHRLSGLPLRGLHVAFEHAVDARLVALSSGFEVRQHGALTRMVICSV